MTGTGRLLAHAPSSDAILRATGFSIIFVCAVFLMRMLRVVRSIHRDRCHRNEAKTASAAATASKPGTQTAAETATPSSFRCSSASDRRTIKTMVILGSGGHTAEMLRLLRELDARRYAPVSYAVAETDATSLLRLRGHVRQEEGNEEVRRREGEGTAATVHRLPRAREVRQSYLSAVHTSLRALFWALALMWKERPELVLANGPGTCVPIVYAAFLLRLLTGADGFGARRFRVVFVESVCRVHTLSLSGKLLYPIVDRFVVHWPGLQDRYQMVELSDVFVTQKKEFESER